MVILSDIFIFLNVLNSTYCARRAQLASADGFVVTEAGFGANIGMTAATAACLFCWSLWHFDLPFLLVVVLLCGMSHVVLLRGLSRDRTIPNCSQF